MLPRSLLPNLQILLAFEATARHGSISRAAEELNLTQSAVSRQVIQLEQALGLALFDRIRRRIVLTDTGRIYAAGVRRSLDSLVEATKDTMTYAGAAGVLNIAVLPTFGARWLAPRLPDFLARHPGVFLNLEARLQPFDMAADPFDAAFHVGAGDWAGAVLTELMPEESVPVASPRYRAEHGIATPADLVHAVLLQQKTRPTAWTDWFALAGIRAQAYRGHRFEQFAMVAAAAVAGAGAALIPRFLIEDDLDAGRLDILFPQSLIGTTSYWIAVPEAKAKVPLVRTFHDWVVEAAGPGRPSVSGRSASRG